MQNPLMNRSLGRASMLTPQSAPQTRRLDGILRMNAIRFDPLLKRIRWGGTRLGTTLGKRLGPETDYAESWEIADHYEDQSIVNTSYFAGSTLQELLRDSNEAILGRHAGRDQFPRPHQIQGFEAWR